MEGGARAGGGTRGLERLGVARLWPPFEINREAHFIEGEAGFAGGGRPGGGRAGLEVAFGIRFEWWRDLATGSGAPLAAM